MNRISWMTFVGVLMAALNGSTVFAHGGAAHAGGGTAAHAGAPAANHVPAAGGGQMGGGAAPAVQPGGFGGGHQLHGGPGLSGNGNAGFNGQTNLPAPSLNVPIQSGFQPGFNPGSTSVHRVHHSSAFGGDGSLNGAMPASNAGQSQFSPQGLGIQSPSTPVYNTYTNGLQPISNQPNAAQSGFHHSRTNHQEYGRQNLMDNGSRMANPQLQNAGGAVDNAGTFRLLQNHHNNFQQGWGGAAGAGGVNNQVLANNQFAQMNGNLYFVSGNNNWGAAPPIAAGFGSAPFYWGTSGFGLGPMMYGSGYWGYNNPFFNSAVYGANFVPFNYGSPIPVNYTAPAPFAITQQMAMAASVVAPNTSSTAVAPAMSPGVFLNGSVTLFRQNDFAGALTFVNEGITKFPNDMVLHELRSLILFAKGDYQQSAGTIHAVLANGPGWNWATMISVYSNSSIYTTQLRALESYVKQNPTDGSGRFLLAYHYMTCGFPEPAAKQLRHVVNLVPTDTVAPALLKLITNRSSTASTSDAANPVPQEPVEIPSPSQVAATPLEPAAIMGDWTAARDDGSSFGLKLADDKTFTWTFTPKGGTVVKLSGTYTLEGNNITLKRTEGGAMTATITIGEGDKFNFKMVGAPAEDTGLNFSK